MTTEHACQHIAIIMDGNGRWAKKRLLPRTFGHKRGVKAVKRTVKAAINLNVKVLTLYAFSTENWIRPEEEVSFLVDLFIKTLNREFKELFEAGVRLSYIGDLTKFPKHLYDQLIASKDESKNNTTLDLVVALNYGSRFEIVEASKKIAEKVQRGDLKIDEITESYFNDQLALSDLPPVDLLIRTSGEQRLSNYLLWQLAYTELYFADCHWPDFNEEHLKIAIDNFSNRERRFGDI